MQIKINNIKIGTAILFILFCLSLSLWGQNIDRQIQEGVDILAKKYMASRDILYSKATLTITALEELSPKARANFLGDVIKARLIQAIGESLVFRYVDREHLDDALKELEMTLSDITETNNEIRLGMIESVAFLLRGKILENGNDFHITLELMEVATGVIVAVTTIQLPQRLLIEAGAQYSFEYIMANGLGFTAHLTPHHSLLFSQTPFQKVGDGLVHGGSGGAKATYRITRNLKIGIDFNFMSGDFYYDGRNFEDAQNIPSALITEAQGMDLYETDGTLTPADAGTQQEISESSLYYSLSDSITTIAIPVSYVLPVNRVLAFSFGMGPAVSFHQYNQTYDNIPTRFGGGVMLKRHEINMTLLGLGLFGNIDAEYFILPRMALNVGVSGLLNWMLDENEPYAKSPTNGESYYSESDVSIEVFGLNPYYRPDGTSILDNMLDVSYFKLYLGGSIYF